jgi:DNA-binding transcriptional ArsR family regulator
MTPRATLSRPAKLGDAQLHSAAQLFSVLSEPTRLRILHLLQEGPATVTQIIEQANASKQLGILHQAGIVGREREGNLVRYSIRLPLVFDLCSLVCDCLREEAKAQAAALR